MGSEMCIRDREDDEQHYKEYECRVGYREVAGNVGHKDMIFGSLQFVGCQCYFDCKVTQNHLNK